MKQSVPDTSKQLYELHKLGYKFYPEFIKGKWFICYSISGQKPIVIQKPIAQNEINISLAKTILYFYEKIKQQ